MIEIIQKPWGHEEILHKEEGILQVKILNVNKGQRTSLQYHQRKKEWMFDLNTGEVKVVNPFEEHRIVGYKRILEVSIPPDDSDIVRLKDDYGRVSK
jgi:D-lyxose ketol-isomerase